MNPVGPPPLDPTPVTQWAVETLLADLTCSVCLDVFTAPVSLPCGHNLCSGCWDAIDTFRCPVCRARCSNPLRVNKVLEVVVGVLPVVMPCGLRLMKQRQSHHASNCTVCLIHDHNTVRAQLNRTRTKLRRLRKRVIESEDSDDVEDVQ